MADSASRGALPRRPSYRSSIAEAGAVLPSECLDLLEQKRKALDDSIHKYIAAKEREYKQYEKELRQQYRTSQPPAAAAAADVGAVQKRRTLSCVETSAEHTSPGGSAVDANTPERGSRRSPDGNAYRGKRDSVDRRAAPGLTDRRASIERDKEFVGLFTPQFLPALDSKTSAAGMGDGDRSSAAPPPTTVDGDNGHDVKEAAQDSKPVTTPDTAVQVAPARRPAQLQSTQRTSSSGSSVDGKLISALKSPTNSQQHDPMRPRRKRVSIAVGDTIVAPSDNVPLPVTNNKTASHSRTRSPASEWDAAPLETGNIPAPHTDGVTSTPPNTDNSEPKLNHSDQEKISEQAQALLAQEPSVADRSTQRRQPPRPATRPGEDIGDMWHMEDSDVAEPEQEDIQDDFDFEDDDAHPNNEIAGRVGSFSQPTSSSRTNEAADSPELSDRAGGPSEEEMDDTAMPMNFARRGSIQASQQPTSPGFRMPSVLADPVYAGMDYDKAKRNADEHDVFGSSFSKPTIKASFTGGSLGESYMARHAEEMMRSRQQQQQQQDSQGQSRRLPPVHTPR